MKSSNTSIGLTLSSPSEWRSNSHRQSSDMTASASYLNDDTNIITVSPPSPPTTSQKARLRKKQTPKELYLQRKYELKKESLERRERLYQQYLDTKLEILRERNGTVAEAIAKVWFPEIYFSYNTIIITFYYFQLQSKEN